VRTHGEAKPWSSERDRGSGLVGVFSGCIGTHTAVDTVGKGATG
jgi:hypothetical protein